MRHEHYSEALRECSGLPGFEDRAWRMPWFRWDWCGPAPPEVWSPGTWDNRTWCLHVLAMDPCAYCGAPVQVIDHVVPQARGGDNDWTNYTAACTECNRSKAGKPLLRYLLQRREAA